MNYLRNNWKELLTMLIGFWLVFWGFPMINGWMDGTEGTSMDASFPQRLLWSGFRAVFCFWLGYTVFHFFFPSAAGFMDRGAFARDLATVDSYQRMKIIVGLLTLVLAVITLCVVIR